MFKYLLIASMFSMPLFAREKLEKKEMANIESVLQANEELRLSFFDYKMADVETAASKMIKQIKQVKHPELTKLLAYPVKKLETIKAEATEDANKEAFGVISLGLANIVRKYDVGGKWNVYSCPMVKKSWIQDSAKVDDVQNPYAASMPNCGRKETSY